MTASLLTAANLLSSGAHLDTGAAVKHAAAIPADWEAGNSEAGAGQADAQQVQNLYMLSCVHTSR